MISRLAVTDIWVKDQNEALRFYTEKLGFEIRADMTFGTFRWLTVGLKGQPDLEFSLMALKPAGSLTQEDVDLLARLLQEGKLRSGVWKTDDCRGTYATLVGRGVEFLQTPTDRPYGTVEAILKDDSGNLMVLSQDKPQQA